MRQPGRGACTHTHTHACAHCPPRPANARTNDACACRLPLRLTPLLASLPCPALQPHHRIFVVDPAKAHTMTVHDQTVVINIKPGTEKPEASGLRPTDVVSQFDVVKLLTEHRDKLELVEAKTLEELEVFEGSVFTVAASASALEAFHHMAMDHKSCLGIVDAAGKLIGNVSLSDIRALSPVQYGLLLSPVAEFVAITQGKGPSATEALEGARCEVRGAGGRGGCTAALFWVPLLICAVHWHLPRRWHASQQCIAVTMLVGQQARK